MKVKEVKTGQYILVCDGGHCKEDGAKKFRKALEASAKDAGIKVDVHKTGCLGRCGKGPAALILPRGLCCTGIKAADAADVLALLEGGAASKPVKQKTKVKKAAKSGKAAAQSDDKPTET